MWAAIDDSIFIDQQSLRAGSAKRDAPLRSAPGVNGLLSLELGWRGRMLHQRGTVRAASRAGLRKIITRLQGLIGGEPVTLRTADGRYFSDLRIECYKLMREQISGAGYVVELEIEYIQLREGSEA